MNVEMVCLSFVLIALNYIRLLCKFHKHYHLLEFCGIDTASGNKLSIG